MAVAACQNSVFLADRMSAIGRILSVTFVLDTSAFRDSIRNVLLNNQRGIKNEGKCDRGNFNYVIHLSVSE